VAVDGAPSVSGQTNSLKGNHMKEYAAAKELVDREFVPGKNVDQYHSVEFSIDGLGVPYQFRIWNIDSTFMFVLVSENSRIFPWLRVGDILNVKYCSTGLGFTFENLDTEIRSITKQNQGRLKGHYLVGFQILERQDQPKIHCPYPSRKTQSLSANVSLGEEAMLVKYTKDIEKEDKSMTA